MIDQPIIIEPSVEATHTIIWLHGLGADGHDFVDIVAELQLPKQHGIRFIFPNAPIRPVTINANLPMRAWFDVYSLTDLNREDEKGIRESQAELEKLIENEIEHGIPSKHVVLAGFSQGGALALFTGLRYPKPLGGIIALSTYLPLMNLLAKEAHVANSKTAIFLTHGDADEVIPTPLSTLTRDCLLQLHYPVDWHLYSKGHAVCQQEILDISQWLGE